MFSMPSLALILRRLMVQMEFLLLFLRIVLPCWHPAWSNSFVSSCQLVFPTSWMYAYIQPVPKKGDRCNPSNYRPVAFLSCLSKVFESILHRKIVKHLSTFNLLSDRQYGFRKERSTGDLLAFLTISWSSALNYFCETFAFALDISKAFDRIWHKALLSKFPSFGFYPSLCTLISSFLSDRSIAAIVDGHCSTRKTINSGVPQGSVLSLTLLLMFINNLFSIATVLSIPMPMILLCITPHLLFKTNFTGFRSSQTWGIRTINLWSCSDFLMGQKELSVL